MPLRRTTLLALSATAIGCSSDDTGARSDAPTYYSDAKVVLDAKCATCHTADGIGPFPMTTHAEIQAFAAPIQASIENGTMPPWQPDDACNTYDGNFDLTDEEAALLVAWLEAGAPEGDPADAPAADSSAQRTFDTDVDVILPEPYTPQREPDDYRCQLIPWPEDAGDFVTGIQVHPDEKALVNHVIAFLVGPDQVEQFQAYDAAEEGPGYTCYGGPTPSSDGGSLENIDPAELLALLEELGLSLVDLQNGDVTPEQMEALLEAVVGGGGGGGLGFSTLGSWVPGAPPLPFPEGTGIYVEPGSMLVIQMHYNTNSADPVPDQSTLSFATTDTVERRATALPAVDLGWVSNGLMGPAMDIPAGESNVSHSTTVAYDSMFAAMARDTLGVADGEPLLIHRANHHMHELGTTIRSEVRHSDGSDSCLLDLPDWDFNWQGDYRLEEPVPLAPGDELWLGCTWDNSEANQPVIDGEVQSPQDVSWGEGTGDEMCLVGFYVTAAQ